MATRKPLLRALTRQAGSGRMILLRAQMKHLGRHKDFYVLAAFDGTFMSLKRFLYVCLSKDSCLYQCSLKILVCMSVKDKNLLRALTRQAGTGRMILLRAQMKHLGLHHLCWDAYIEVGDGRDQELRGRMPWRIQRSFIQRSRCFTVRHRGIGTPLIGTILEFAFAPVTKSAWISYASSSYRESAWTPYASTSTNKHLSRLCG